VLTKVKGPREGAPREKIKGDNPMKAAEAVRVINELAYRPGVKPQATDMSWYVRDGRELVAIEFLMDTKDSSVVSASGQYTRSITIAPGKAVDVASLTETDLLYKLVELDAEFQEHETREFLRVLKGGRWVAPFHPHNYDTDALFNQYQKGAVAA
jgi:hypothetical protein